MRKYSSLILVLFAAIFLYRCVIPVQNRNEKITDPVSERLNDTFHLICQYWELTDAEHPTTRDVSQPGGNGFSLDPGIVFMTDSTVLENPAGEMRYGKFNLHGNEIKVVFDKGITARYLITRLHKDELNLKRTENNSTSELVYTPTYTYWPDAKKNPFAKQNYEWSIKPVKPETDEEIRNRVKQCVQFYSYYLKGYTDGGATKIDFKSIPACFNWYWGGIGVQSATKIDKKWINCFYSYEQAMKGRQMLDDVITKKYKWDEKETDWVKQSVPVLKQIHDSL